MQQPTVSAQGQMILVVDDDADVRTVLADAFDADGFRVMTAANGMQALHRVRDAAPDAIILDLNMPMMTGDDFLYAWRGGAETHRIPVVAISAAYPGLHPEDFGGRPARAARQGSAGVSATALRCGELGGGGQRDVARVVKDHERDRWGRREARQRPRRPA